MTSKVKKDFNKMSNFSAILALIATLVIFFFIIPQPFSENEIILYTNLAEDIVNNGAEILYITESPDYNYIALYSDRLMIITNKGSIVFPYDSFSPSISTIDPWFGTIIISFLSFFVTFLITLFINVGLYDLILKRKRKI